MGRGGHEVEGGLGAGEDDLAATTDEQAVEVVELELHAVDEHVAGLADVDDPQLAALEVRRRTEHVPARELELPVTGHRATDDQSVVVGVDAVHLAGTEEVLDEEALPQVRARRRLHAGRRHGMTHLDQGPAPRYLNYVPLCELAGRYL